METTAASASPANSNCDPIDAPPPFAPRDVLDYAFNVVCAGHFAGIYLQEQALVLAMLDAAGDPITDARKLGSREVSSRLRRAALARRARPQPVTVSDPSLAANLDHIGEALGLRSAELDIVRFLVVLELNGELNSLLSEIRCKSLGTAVRILAAAVGWPVADVERAVGASGRLVSGGFLILDPCCVDLDDAFTLDRRVRQMACGVGLSTATVLDRFLPRAPIPTLTFDDYPADVRDAARRIARLIAAALDTRAPGVNVLIFGPTGAGKTVLAGLLASAANASLYLAGREDDEGLAPDSRQRLGALRLGHRVLLGGRAVVAFDELEDLFVRDEWSRTNSKQGRDAARMSKLWFNQLLESAPIPTIWLSNDVNAMDPAFLRRFAVALELRWPSLAQRRRLWRKCAGVDLPLSDTEVTRLAERFPVSPAQIESTTRMARLLGEREDLGRTLEDLLAPVAALLGSRTDRSARVAGHDYDPALASTRIDLAALAERLAAFEESDGPGLSLCLYGPPGTGKSEYVRYLADRLDRPLIVRRCSDLLSPWVGGTEKHLADAFREAKEERALLLLDEADSFLRDRRRATQTWEATQVNELLQQLEVFSGVVACTTNLFHELDQAALRRFAFRIRFEYLPPDKTRSHLRRLLAALGVRANESELGDAERSVSRLAALTPGDFAVVARRLRVLGASASLKAAAVVRELEEEVTVKDVPGRTAGFASGQKA